METTFLTINSFGEYDSHVTKNTETGVYTTHGTIGEGNEFENAEELMKFILQYPSDFKNSQFYFEN